MGKTIHQLQIFLQTNVTNMPYSNYLAISSVFFFLFSSSFFFSTKATPIYTSHVCTDSTKNQPNTTFQTNLNLLLSSLSSLSSNATEPTQFYKTTIATETPNPVKGLFLCRGDTLASACYDCVTTAATDLKRWCPVQKEAIIWYDVCMVRYSNHYLNNIVPKLRM
ncbi:hypothetical protein V8G54_022382 [Vigna mungo]|uniref:Gnk2-homologous domain-containing protein n=1 Tax=Vigna mungo TaxID=3915 RepID=A0AAQ3NHF7_VIGMU